MFVASAPESAGSWRLQGPRVWEVLAVWVFAVVGAASPAPVVLLDPAAAVAAAAPPVVEPAGAGLSAARGIAVQSCPALRHRRRVVAVSFEFAEG